MDHGGSKSELQTIQEIARDTDLHIKYGQQTEDHKTKCKLLVLQDHETVVQTCGESKAGLVHDTN